MTHYHSHYCTADAKCPVEVVWSTESYKMLPTAPSKALLTLIRVQSLSKRKLAYTMLKDSCCWQAFLTGGGSTV